MTEHERAALEKAAASLAVTHPIPAGWTWRLDPVAETPGWFHASARGPEPHDVLIGSVSYLGPGGQLLSLSTNPFAHARQHTLAVLAELGTADADPQMLAAEIGRRTRTPR